MKFMEEIAEKWSALCSKVRPVVASVTRVLKKAGDVIMSVWAYIVKFRKIFLAVPVVFAAVKLAQQNMERLPETVGLDLQIDGTFAVQMTRFQASWSPVLLTLICLVLMFCSKRVLTPWVVSLLTLLIPVVIWVLNVFPA